MAFSALGTAYSTAGLAAGSHAVSMPTNVVRGERLLAFFALDSSIDPVVASAGWSEIARSSIAVPNGQSLVVMEKFAVIGEPGSYTFTTGSNYHVAAVIGKWTGRSRAAAKVSTPATNTTGNASPVTVTANGVTAENGDDIISVFALDAQTNGDSWTFSTVSGMTERAEIWETAWCPAVIDTQDNVAAGATGTKVTTATQTGGSSGTGWLAFTIALPKVKGIAGNSANAIVNGSSGTTVSSGNIGPNNPTAGNKLWVTCFGFGDMTFSLSDTQGISFSPLSTRIFNAGRNVTIQEFLGTVLSTSAESILLTCSITNGLRAIWVEEVESSYGVLNTRAAQVVNAGTGDDAPSSGNATNTTQPALALSFVWDLQGAIENPGNGYTQLSKGWNDGSTIVALTQAKEVTTSGVAISATAQDTGFDWHYVSVNLFVPIPSNYAPGVDVQVAGWTPTPDGRIFDTIDEDGTPVDTNYVTSPLLRSVAEKCILLLDNPMPAGSYTVNIRAKSTSSTGNLRVRFLDAANADVGVTSIQGITTTLTTYSLSVTTTGTATQVQIEVTT